MIERILQDMAAQLRDFGSRLERQESAESAAHMARAQVYRAATQAIGHNSWTAISFDTEIEDTAAVWAVANPTRLYAPVAGVYLFTANAEIAAHATGLRSLAIRTGGVTYRYMSHHLSVGAGLGTVINLAGLVSMTAGSYAEIVVYHNAGAGVNLNVGGCDASNHHKGGVRVARIS